MSKTGTSVGLLKSIALIAGLAILLWSLGLPSLRFADAASLVTVSDTLTDSAPSADSDHEIAFTMSNTGSVAASGGTIDITFPGTFTLGSIATGDMDIEINGGGDDSANWTLSLPGGNVVRLTETGGNTGIAANDPVVIKLGTNATGGTNQIQNPGSEGSYEINITAGSDTGSTRVVVINSVAVSASVDTIFTFAISGVDSGVSVNGETTSGSSSTTSIPFGKLDNTSATTSAQQLTVNTNASNGYVVTVQSDSDLQSTTGGVIDGFSNGTDIDTPVTWSSQPLGSDIDDPKTWGHWGFTTDDATTTRTAPDEFDANEFAAVSSTTARVVMSHDGPANGTGTGVGTTYVAYKVQITALQEAGDDYSTNLTYVATPTF